MPFISDVGQLKKSLIFSQSSYRTRIWAGVGSGLVLGLGLELVYKVAFWAFF